MSVTESSGSVKSTVCGLTPSSQPGRLNEVVRQSSLEDIIRVLVHGPLYACTSSNDMITLMEYFILLCSLHTNLFCRVTQTYDVGACMYFYFGFKYAGLSDPVHVYEQIEVCNVIREHFIVQVMDTVYLRLLLVMKFSLEEEVYLIIMEVNNTTTLVNIKLCFSVGKIRRCWMRDSLSDTGVKMLEAVKKELDPQNTFGCGNLLPSKL